jgi:hypothetical protein
MSKRIRIKEESEYQKFFKAKLKKYGVKSPSQLKGDKEKKFYDEIDREWKKEDDKKESTKKSKIKSLVKEYVRREIKMTRKQKLTTESFNLLEMSDKHKAELLRTSMRGYVGADFSKVASDEDLLKMSELNDEIANIYNQQIFPLKQRKNRLRKKYRLKPIQD